MMKSKPTLIVFIKTLKKTSVLVLWSFEVTSLSSNKWPHLQPTHVCACNIASLSLVCFTEVHLSNDYCTNVSPAIRLSSTAFVLRRDCTWVLLCYLVSTYKGVYVTACDVFPFAHLATLLLHTPTTAPPHTHWHSHTYTVVDLERYTVVGYVLWSSSSQSALQSIPSLIAALRCNSVPSTSQWHSFVPARHT